MSFDLAAGFPQMPVTMAAEAGGTSGIVVDNSGNNGQASSLYFSTLSSASCYNGSTTQSTAACAVKRTQSGLQ
jgi:hypothetical protein